MIDAFRAAVTEVLNRHIGKTYGDRAFLTWVWRLGGSSDNGVRVGTLEIHIGRNPGCGVWGKINPFCIKEDTKS